MAILYVTNLTTLMSLPFRLVTPPFMSVLYYQEDSNYPFMQEDKNMLVLLLSHWFQDSKHTDLICQRHEETIEITRVPLLLLVLLFD